MSWKSASPQDEAWTREYIATVLATPTPSVPPHELHIVGALATWEEIDPGVAMITTSGGSLEDRVLAEVILRDRLASVGYDQAKFIPWGEELRKTADWNDVMAKAKRLIQSGAVHMIRNSQNVAVAMVQGDHGNYETHVYREDPRSQAITQWTCDCDWSQYAWQRTRQWKKYEGRPCSHATAVHWVSQNSPLDEEVSPGRMPITAPLTPGPQPTGAPPPMAPPPTPAQMLAPAGEMMLQNPLAPQPPMVPMPTQPVGLLPVAPAEIGPPPTSIPGGQLPSPYNPVQYPGGTFSKVAAQLRNGDMVQLKEEAIGQAMGKSEFHGDGAWITIPANSIGEVLDQDETTGYVEVLFAGPAAQNKELEPYHVRAFFEASELIPRPDVQRPGPAVRRRR